MHVSKPLLVYVTGMTNAGKSTFLDAHREDPRHAFVEVGKALRAKYPPSHFAGKCNPAHTAAEAWAIYLAGVAQAEAREEVAFVFIDGQPRDAIQIEAVLADRERAGRRIFLHLWAPERTLRERAQRRDGADAERLALSMARLTNDVAPNYLTVCRLLSAGERVIIADTTAPSYNPGSVLSSYGLWRPTL